MSADATGTQIPLDVLVKQALKVIILGLEEPDYRYSVEDDGFTWDVYYFHRVAGVTGMIAIRIGTLPDDGERGCVVGHVFNGKELTQDEWYARAKEASAA